MSLLSSYLDKRQALVYNTAKALVLRPVRALSILICHSLTTSLLHLLLSVALRFGLSPSSSKSTQHAFQSTGCRKGGIDSIPWHNQIEPPHAVSKQKHKDDIDPGPVQYIPHELCQAFGFQVVARTFEGAIWVVRRAGKTVKIEFDYESRSREKSVACKRKRAAKGEP